jgi:hypothetical protein
MKTKYFAGLYELMPEHSTPNNPKGNPYRLTLTAVQAKTLMNNHFYNQIGFSSIELIGKIGYDQKTQSLNK